jgi:hypothetical protein
LFPQNYSEKGEASAHWEAIHTFDEASSERRGNGGVGYIFILLGIVCSVVYAIVNTKNEKI